MTAATPWWRAEEPRKRAADVVAAARGIRDRQSERRAWLTLAYGLYGDFDAFDLSPTGYSVERTSSADVPTVLNLVRACADTVRAELIQSKPRPMFMPSGADWSVRKKCSQLGRFCEGLFAEQAFDRTASEVAMDAILFGTGIVRVLTEQGRPCLERVMPWEVWVDEQDGYYRKPRAIYLLRYVHRDELLALYPDAAAAIETAQGDDRRWVRTTDTDHLPVVEAWHLPTGDDDDGRHVIAIDGEMLFEEEWEHNWLPFAFMRWKTPLCGFWGNGLAAELYEIQCDVNRVVEAVQVGQRLNTWPRLAVPRSAQVNTEQLTDEPGTMFEYSGPQPPTALVWPGCPPEIYQWLTSQIEWAFQFSGVSMSAARSEKSAGVTSGRAIQLESNLQSRRFIDVQRAFEQLYLDTARVLVGVMEHEAANDNADVEVVWRGKYRAERIKWTQARLEESGYVIRLTPVSALASSPSGRVDQISSLMNSGFAQQAGAPLPLLIRALEAPDSESLLGPISVAYDLVERICEDLLEDNDARRPEPFFNLSVCLLVGVLTYQQWCLWDVPEDRLDALRDWLDEVREMAEEAAAAQPQPPQGAPAPPPPAAAA